MKLKHIFISLSASALFFTSCRNEFLDEKPSDAITKEELFSNEQGLNIALNGLYNSLQSSNALGGNVQTLNELLADQAFVALENSGYFIGTREPDQGFFKADIIYFYNLWDNLYKNIKNANEILANEGQIADNAGVEGTPSNVFAQAKALRALSYFTLVTHFSENYGEGNQELGVPLVLSYDISAKPARNTVEEVYAQIIKDLEAALPDLSDQGSNTRINKTAVELLLSRVYLAKKDYNKANEYAQKVLDNSNYTLLAKNQVKEFFSSDFNSKERIFQIDYNSKDTNSSGPTQTWGVFSIYRQNFATKAFYDQLGDKDVRKEVWYHATSQNPNVNLNDYTEAPNLVDVSKYRSNVDPMLLFRKTEAVFNQVEALYHLNPSLAAEKLEQWVKTYRDEDYVLTAKSGQALLKEILNQKNLEFFLEGFRYQDLKRNHLDSKNLVTGVSLKSTDLGFKAFPLPQYEVNSNPNIKQFPGYTSAK